ncbi:MAG: mechanosensitive ion channel family protein [Calditrichia bacterium]
MELANRIFLQNSIQQWLVAILVALGSLLILQLIKKFAHNRISAFAKKTKTDVDDLIAELIARIKFIFLLVLALYFASLALILPLRLTGIIGKLVIVAVLLQTAYLGSGLITFWTHHYRRRKMDVDAASVTTFSALAFLGQLVLWSVIVILALDNIGVDITALIAGLGVGGIAIALAVQNILGDLFASLSIVIDKPFVIGDFIIVGDYLGSVEHIGLKTTRIRSLSGEQLVFSNGDLLSSRIRNFKRMYERRVVFSLGLIYQTPPDKLKKATAILKEIIQSLENVRFDRAHFKEYGNLSLNFEVVYWVKSPDYNVYMDIQQEINLQIYQRFTAEGLEFAYPTQTLFMTSENPDNPNISTSIN